VLGEGLASATFPLRGILRPVPQLPSKSIFISLPRAVPRGILAAAVASLALGAVGYGDESWNGPSEQLDSEQPNGHAVQILGSSVVTIFGTTSTVFEDSVANSASGPTFLMLDSSSGTHTLKVAFDTAIAGEFSDSLTVSGSANFRTGVLTNGGFSGAQLTKNGGVGELIIDGIPLPDSGASLEGAVLSVVEGTISIEGAGGFSPIPSLNKAILINGANGKLRFGSVTGSGTTFTKTSVVAALSGTLEHTTATNDTLGGSLTVEMGQILNANITGGSLAVTGSFGGSLTKNGGGVLRLNGTSVVTTPATTPLVSAGRLEILGPATLGTVPVLSAGATLALLSGTGNSVPSAWTLTSGTLEIVPGALGSATVSLMGGGLRFSASGAASSFSNPVTASGNSAIDVTGMAAQLTALTLQPGVVLTKTGMGLTATSFVFNGAGVYTINSSGSDFKIPGSGQVAVSLVKTGSGVLEITGANTSAATTTVSAGTIRVGDGGSLPSGAITDNAELEFNRSTPLTVANAINGSGAVTKRGAGTLNLNGAQGYATLNTIAGAGTTNVNGAFTGGTATVNANATTNFTVSQTLAALNIGTTAFAGESNGFQSAPMVVPEPGVLGLLLIGALGGLSRRRR